MQAIPALPVAGPANPAPLPQAVEVDTVTVPAQSAGLVIDRTNLLAHSNTRYAEMPRRLPRLNAREQREPARERTAQPLVEPRRLGPPPAQPARRAPGKAAPAKAAPSKAKGLAEPQRSSRPARATRGYP